MGGEGGGEDVGEVWARCAREVRGRCEWGRGAGEVRGGRMVEHAHVLMRADLARGVGGGGVEHGAADAGE